MIKSAFVKTLKPIMMAIRQYSYIDFVIHSDMAGLKTLLFRLCSIDKIPMQVERVQERGGPGRTIIRAYDTNRGHANTEKLRKWLQLLKIEPFQCKIEEGSRVKVKGSEVPDAPQIVETDESIMRQYSSGEIQHYQSEVGLHAASSSAGPSGLQKIKPDTVTTDTKLKISASPSVMIGTSVTKALQVRKNTIRFRVTTGLSSDNSRLGPRTYTYVQIPPPLHSCEIGPNDEWRSVIKSMVERFPSKHANVLSVNDVLADSNGSFTQLLTATDVINACANNASVVVVIFDKGLDLILSPTAFRMLSTIPSVRGSGSNLVVDALSPVEMREEDRKRQHELDIKRLELDHELEMKRLELDHELEMKRLELEQGDK
jgi:hypothetical protein